MIYRYIECSSLYLHSQKLYQREPGKAKRLRQLATDSEQANWLGLHGACSPIRWAKYATALRRRTVEIKAILRRFTKKNVQHPTYKAFAKLGKVIKTIFLCRYLHDEVLRREINEGLNIVEEWNGATDFVFFARRGEMESNYHEDHEVSMLVLHLIQNYMAYINTPMI